MAVQTAVDVLARMLESYDAGDRSVHHVGATSVADGGDALHVDLEVTVPVGTAGDGAATAPERARLSEDGHLQVEYPGAAMPSLPSHADADVEVEPTSARVADDRILLSMEVTITPTGDGEEGRAPNGEDARADGAAVRRDDDRLEATPQGTGSEDARRDATARGEDTRTDPGSDDADPHAVPGDDAATDTDHGTDTDGGPASPGRLDDEPPDEFAALRNDAVPPYEDTPYLQAVYERHDTFDEMREVIEMDVSTETVRRYMIDVDVHDPSSYRSDGPGSESTDGDATDVTVDEEAPDVDEPLDGTGSIPDEKLVTDGIGLPEDLSIEGVLEAVVDSSTVYEVTRTLDMDQRRTRTVLEQLDLLELVMTRVSDDHKRDVTYEDVADRLRQTAESAG